MAMSHGFGVLFLLVNQWEMIVCANNSMVTDIEVDTVMIDSMNTSDSSYVLKHTTSRETTKQENNLGTTVHQQDYWIIERNSYYQAADGGAGTKTNRFTPGRDISNMNAETPRTHSTNSTAAQMDSSGRNQSQTQLLNGTNSGHQWHGPHSTQDSEALDRCWTEYKNASCSGVSMKTVTDETLTTDKCINLCEGVDGCNGIVYNANSMSVTRKQILWFFIDQVVSNQRCELRNDSCKIRTNNSFTKSTVFIQGSCDNGKCINGEERNCHKQATCTKSKGIFRCQCKPGYTGDGMSCSDNNECANGNHNCDDHATCTNTVGSYTCQCQPGYEGNGTKCIDVDECSKMIHTCGRSATCVNKPGGFSCTCPSGMVVGPGNNCTCKPEQMLMKGRECDSCWTPHHNAACAGSNIKTVTDATLTADNCTKLCENVTDCNAVVYDANAKQVTKKRVLFFSYDETVATRTCQLRNDSCISRTSGSSMVLVQATVGCGSSYNKFDQSTTEHAGVAKNAIDGKASTNFFDYSCTQTASSYRPWWYVDLGAQQTVTSVSILNRGDCCSNRLTNYDVAVVNTPPSRSCLKAGGAGCRDYAQEGTLCFRQVTNYVVGKWLSMTCNNKGVKGRYLVVQMRASGILTMCEIQATCSAQVGTINATDHGKCIPKY